MLVVVVVVVVGSKQAARRRGRRPLRPPGSAAVLRNQRQPPTNFFSLHQHSAPQSIASPSFVFTSCDRSSCQYDQLYSHIGHSCIPMNYATNLDSCSLGQSAPLVLLASPEIQLCNPSYWPHHHPDYFRHSTAAGAPSSMF